MIAFHILAAVKEVSNMEVIDAAKSANIHSFRVSARSEPYKTSGVTKFHNSTFSYAGLMWVQRGLN